jgi:hypothetical protein
VLARLAPHVSRLLQLEGLRPEEFVKPISEYDEVPIYTRLDRLDFLSGFSHEERSIALLALALDFLEQVIVRAASLPVSQLSEFFVMITVLDWENFHGGGIVTPCFWTTSRATEELSPMRLVPPFTSEAERVQRWLAELGCASSYLVADCPTAPTAEFPLRVHIGPVELPRAEMRGVRDLLRRRRAEEFGPA